MTDQELLEFKEKYQNNPVAFAEDFYGVKLYHWQKTLLNMLNGIDNCKQYICNIPYRYGKKMIGEAQIEYMKVNKKDFQVWTTNGIEVYEKGILVRTIERETI